MHFYWGNFSLYGSFQIILSIWTGIKLIKTTAILINVLFFDFFFTDFETVGPRRQAGNGQNKRREAMAPWLRHHLEAGDVRGLKWTNRALEEFSICWKHAAKKSFDPNKDSQVFKLWAIHSGKCPLKFKTCVNYYNYMVPTGLALKKCLNLNAVLKSVDLLICLENCQFSLKSVWKWLFMGFKNKGDFCLGGALALGPKSVQGLTHSLFLTGHGK